jgi:hypothetical protein
MLAAHRDHEARIEALERENAAMKDAIKQILGGVRPAVHSPNPFHIGDVRAAQAVWDILFGAEGGA